MDRSGPDPRRWEQRDMAEEKQSTSRNSEGRPGQGGGGNAAPDALQQQPTTLLTGFLGEGAPSGGVRLYLTPQFDQYVDLSADDVVHTSPLTTDDSGLGATMVWLKAGTPVRLSRTVSQHVQAEFLQGAITTAFMPAGSFSAMPTVLAATGYACTRNYVCSTNPHIPACQMHTDVCGSAFCGPDTGALCPSGAFIC
jgi:hypothetical protein